MQTPMLISAGDRSISCSINAHHFAQKLIARLRVRLHFLGGQRICITWHLFSLKIVRQESFYVSGGAARYECKGLQRCQEKMIPHKATLVLWDRFYRIRGLTASRPANIVAGPENARSNPFVFAIFQF